MSLCIKQILMHLISNMNKHETSGEIGRCGDIFHILLMFSVFSSNASRILCITPLRKNPEKFNQNKLLKNSFETFIAEFRHALKQSRDDKETMDYLTRGHSVV
ncbi:hypothetical protein ILYODFUR_035658 [Ilyodon furcidens]|uniref:Uncharacterized protein n=1 Tax=Ilyodon furcidens TaxID=33524 RepID=A0ABV0T328_9TELE